MAAMFQGPIVARPLADNPWHRRDVERIIMACADYSQWVKGGPPRREESDDIFCRLPPGCLPADKFPLGFYVNDRVSGIALAVRRWNAPHKAHIGLLLLASAFRGHGHGLHAYAHMEAQARTWPGITCLRLAAIDNHHAALNFRHRLGFAETAELRGMGPPYPGDKIVLEKSLIGEDRI